MQYPIEYDTGRTLMIDEQKSIIKVSPKKKRSEGRRQNREIQGFQSDFEDLLRNLDNT